MSSIVIDLQDEICLLYTSGVGLPAYKAPVRCSAGYAGGPGISIPPPSLLAVRPCAEYRNPPVRTNRGSLFFPTAGTFRPRLGSTEFGFCGLRSVGRYGADRPSPAFSCAALYFCYSNKVCSARMPQRTGTNTAANMTRKADI